MSDTQKDWAGYGYNRFMVRSLSPSDPNFQSSEDFNNSTEDASIRSAKIGGRIYAKLVIVNDGVNDRVLIGYQKDGF
jgi:hypothetical protein